MKDWREVLEALKRECQSYKRVTAKRLREARQVIKEIEKMLDEVGIREMSIQIENRKYCLRYFKSRIGSWFNLARVNRFFDSEREFLLPSEVTDIDGECYLHGDFRARVVFMSREETLQAIKDLPLVVEEIYRKIKSYREEFESAY
jgi:hypothetical protein